MVEGLWVFKLFSKDCKHLRLSKGDGQLDFQVSDLFLFKSGDALDLDLSLGKYLRK